MRSKWAAAVAAMTAVGVMSGCGGAQEAPAPVNREGLVLPDQAGILKQATEHYGPLVVTETPPEGLDARADVRPWASYWYPITDDILVAGSEKNGGQCTLDKYDRYSSKVFGRTSRSTSFEISNGDYIASDQLGWEGRCNAWAYASVLEPEPVLPPEGVEAGGVRFFTRDVKALLLKTYETIDDQAVIRFGERYQDRPDPNRPAKNDYQDIYPDQFHRVLQAELFEKHRPILMDSDAGVPVWNKPIWWANTIIRQDPSSRYLVHVTTDVKATMSETILPDFVSKWSNLDIKTFTYTYDLYGEPQGDGSLQIKYGKWTGKSIQEHPDFVTALPEKGARIRHASRNEQLDQAVIDDILLKTGAFSRYRLE